MTRLIGVAAGTLALAVALTTGLALAHTVKFDSTVTARYKTAQDRFKGKVRSEKTACERRRTVKVFRKRAGADQLLGKDKSNSDGEWQLEPETFPPDTYYAKATKKVLKHTAHHRHTCKPAKSDGLFAGQPPCKAKSDEITVLGPPPPPPPPPPPCKGANSDEITVGGP